MFRRSIIADRELLLEATMMFAYCAILTAWLTCVQSGVYYVSVSAWFNVIVQLASIGSVAIVGGILI